MNSWPTDPQDFRDLRELKSHGLTVLLKLSGRESTVKRKYQNLWSQLLGQWTPEMRYLRVGAVKRKTAAEMIDCVEQLVKII